MDTSYKGRASFKTSHFGQSLRWAQISILKILNVFFRLKSSPALTLTKLKRFEIGSVACIKMELSPWTSKTSGRICFDCALHEKKYKF
jgi:hypothetical protein